MERVLADLGQIAQASRVQMYSTHNLLLCTKNAKCTLTNACKDFVQAAWQKTQYRTNENTGAEATHRPLMQLANNRHLTRPTESAPNKALLHSASHATGLFICCSTLSECPKWDMQLHKLEKLTLCRS